MTAKLRHRRLSKLFRWPHRLGLRIPFWILVVAMIWKAGDFTLNLLLPYRPQPIAEVPFPEHARTRTSEGIRVTTSALKAQESYQPTTLGEIEMLEWERPATMPRTGPLFGRRTPTESGENEANQ
jgi:hypothetical protein